MKGYTQTNETAATDVSERVLPQSVSNYSIGDCEYYLSHYPNGLKADAVRKQLSVLKPDVVPSKVEKNSTPKPQSKKDSTATSSSKSQSSKVVDTPLHTDTSKDSGVTLVYILKVIASIAIIALGIGIVVAFISGGVTWTWFSFFIYLGGCSYLWNKLWN